jgi:hypothetical protein
MRDIDNSADIIDIRDLIARIEELREERDSWVLGAPDGVETANPEGWRIDEPYDAAELDTLESFVGEMKGSGGDHQWEGEWYPVTLVRDSYFEDYAKDEAEQLDLIKDDVNWPYNCIDWTRAANELQMDYSSADYDGITYWFR